MLVERNEVDNINNLTRDRRHGGLALYTLAVERDSDPRRYWNLPRRRTLCHHPTYGHLR